MTSFIGKGEQRTACGDQSFWDAVFSRPLLEWKSQPRNALVIYGKGYVVRDLILPERWPLETWRMIAHD